MYDSEHWLHEIMEDLFESARVSCLKGGLPTSSLMSFECFDVDLNVDLNVFCRLKARDSSSDGMFSSLGRFNALLAEGRGVIDASTRERARFEYVFRLSMDMRNCAGDGHGLSGTWAEFKRECHPKC